MANSSKQISPKEAFGKTLREFRLASGMSQEELAYRADIDRTYVSSCERGHRNVTLETVVKLAAALDIKSSELFAGIDKGGARK